MKTFKLPILLRYAVVVAIAVLMAPTEAEAQIVSKATLKYLDGAVPVVDGIVTYTDTIALEGRTKDDIFETMRVYFDSLVSKSDHEEYSRVTERDASSGVLAASVAEWMYFKRSSWKTDFCHFRYQLIAECGEEVCVLKLWRINYIYDEERYAKNATYTAEEWITDENAYKKNSRELKKAPGKFRRATVDRVEEIFKEIAALF